jgi:hypothetical protein
VQHRSPPLILLLDSFLFSAFSPDDPVRLGDLARLPASYRQFGKLNPDGITGWSAWHTADGFWLLKGRVDQEQSEAVRASVVWIEWMDAAGERHKGWWHCYRLDEWIAGRGHA